MNEYKTHLHCLNIDVTRRCNLNCGWCYRGEPEDIDITTDIIDDLFEKTKNICLHSISLHGGEPLLRPDMVQYIVDQIIKRRLMVGCMLIYTNGTIKDSTVKASLDKFCDYAKSIESEFCELTGVPQEEIQNGEKVKIVVGVRYHDTAKKQIDYVIEYYIKNNDRIIAVKDEEEEGRMGGYIIGGRLEENYPQYIKNPVNPDQTTILHVECNFIINYNYSKIHSNYLYDNYIPIIISVASNGNVLPGTQYPYKKIDDKPMFNILEIDDFYESILNWCWKHPVNPKIRQLREHKLLYDWCISHGYEYMDILDEEVNEMNSLLLIANGQELCAKDIHTRMPELNFIQVDLLASANIFITLKRNNISRKLIRAYILQCTNLGTEFIDMDIEDAERYKHYILADAQGTLSKNEIAMLLCADASKNIDEKIKILVEYGNLIQRSNVINSKNT